jgi:cytochrome c-type biogenesis protein CcmF
MEAVSGDKISVGAPFFNLTFGALMVPLLAAVPFGPLLAWKRGDLYAATQRLAWALGGAIFVSVVVMLFVDRTMVFAALSIGLATWLMLGAVTDLALRSGLGSQPRAVVVQRLLGLPRSAKGTALAHFGLGVTVVGIVATLAFQTEQIVMMKPGDTIDLAGRQLRFERIEPFTGPNYKEDRGRFTLISGNREIGSIISAKRIYTARQMPTTEAGILTRGFSQAYISLGDPAQDGSWVVRAWWKPMVTLIWLGPCLMMAGGVLSISDRRLRVGAPARRKSATQAAGAV